MALPQSFRHGLHYAIFFSLSISMASYIMLDNKQEKKKYKNSSMKIFKSGQKL